MSTLKHKALNSQGLGYERRRIGKAYSGVTHSRYRPQRLIAGLLVCRFYTRGAVSTLDNALAILGFRLAPFAGLCRVDTGAILFGFMSRVRAGVIAGGLFAIAAYGLAARRLSTICRRDTHGEKDTSQR